MGETSPTARTAPPAGRISPEALGDLVETRASERRALMETICRLREAALAPDLRPPPRPVRLLYRIRRRPRPWQRLADWRATLPEDPAYRAWALAHEPPLVVRPDPPRPPVAFWVRLLPAVDPARYRPLAESLDRVARPADRKVYVAAADRPDVFGPGWVRVAPDDGGAARRVLPPAAWVLWFDAPGVVPFWLWAALAPHLAEAGAAVLYADEDVLRAGRRAAPQFKPEFAPAMLRATHYLTGLLAVRRDRFEGAWPVASGYALALAVTQEATAVRHVPEVLFSALDPPARDAEEEWQALRAALDPTGWTAARTAVPAVFAVRPRVAAWPSVAVIIPSRDNWPYLSRCLASLEPATYPDLSVLVVDNGSRDPTTLAGLATLGGRIRVRRDDRPFHFARLMNAAAREVDAEVLLFLNDDTEALAPDWIQAMVAHLADPGVGAVGAVLLFPDGRIQHAGVVLGIRGGAAHAFKFHPWGERVYHDYPLLVREWSAVTGACLAVRRETFWAVGGFDEAYAASFNDIDLCLRLGERGLRILCTPEARLVHHETISRPRTMDPEEVRRFIARWSQHLARPDPYYSPHLSQWTEDFTPRVVDVAPAAGAEREARRP
ncbi:MAG: glycosyltransferase family 2 protein [Actinomycetia bacterium]|nr:glycosyltransferase family 2 protein [Actinomycetes bacterium]